MLDDKEGPGERRLRLREVVKEFFVQFKRSPREKEFKKDISGFEDKLGRHLTDEEKDLLSQQGIKLEKTNEEEN